MHRVMLVIGEDPIGQLTKDAPDCWTRTDTTATRRCRCADPDYRKTAEENGACLCYLGDDWYGIGGRYSGSLAPQPGATTGRVYGDTMPAIEAAIAGYMPDGASMQRPGREIRDGVDQIRIGELDIDASMRRSNPVAVVINGIVHEHDLTPEETATLTALSMAASHPEISLPPDVEDGEEARSAMRKLEAWDERVTRLLASVDPTELVTLIDVHS